MSYWMLDTLLHDLRRVAVLALAEVTNNTVACAKLLVNNLLNDVIRLRDMLLTK